MKCKNGPSWNTMRQLQYTGTGHATGTVGIRGEKKARSWHRTGSESRSGNGHVLTRTIGRTKNTKSEVPRGAAVGSAAVRPDPKADANATHGREISVLN